MVCVYIKFQPSSESTEQVCCGGWYFPWSNLSFVFGPGPSWTMTIWRTNKSSVTERAYILYMRVFFIKKLFICVILKLYTEFQSPTILKLVNKFVVGKLVVAFCFQIISSWTIYCCIGFKLRVYYRQTFIQNWLLYENTW